MAVQGTAKTQNEGTGSYQKSIGLGVYTVLGVNLSNEELKEHGFYVKEGDENVEREFTGDKEGVDTVRLEFACQSVVNENDRKKFSFFLENEVRQNKTATLTHFINSQGAISWSTNPDKYVGINTEYDVYFTGLNNVLTPRPALKGEEELMLFMKSVFANMDWKAGATLVYDTKKWFKGNFNELNKDLQTEFASSVIVANTIKEKQADEGVKHVESFYNKAFAPGSYWKFLVNKKEFTETDAESIQKRFDTNKTKKDRKEKSYINPLETLVMKMSDVEHGCKDTMYLGILKPFNAEDFVATSSNTVSETSSDY